MIIEQNGNCAPIIGISRHRLATDGCGVTTLVGFHGCPLRCRYCLNPHSFAEDTKRTVMTPEELYERVKIDQLYFLASGGGVTFSGGEPLMQWRFLLEAMDQLSEYHLAIETSGYADSEVFNRVIEKADLVIMDIKIADPEAHKLYTGVDNSIILENLKALQESGKPHIIRTPLIPGITDTEENLCAIESIVKSSKWERLPYNKMAGAKYGMLGLKYELD